MVRRILVVEDERKLAELVKAFLTERGFAVLLAHDGEKGVEVALREKPAVVLSDVLLPKLNGWDLCRRIKAEPSLAGTKVILMTAVYTKARYRADAVEAGADDFVAKPLDLEDLAIRLGGLCDPGRPAAAKAVPAAAADEANSVSSAASSNQTVPVPRPVERPAPSHARVEQQPEERPAAPPPKAPPERVPSPTVPPAEPVAVVPRPQPLTPTGEPAAPRRQKPSVNVEEVLAELAPKPRVAPATRVPQPQVAAKESDFDLHMAALRRRFAAGLPATMSKIEQAWVAAAGGCERGPWEEIAHLAHDLAGSAGSFGLPAVGDAARELEESVRTHLASGVPIGGKARAAIKQYVERLGALIHLL